MERQRRRLSAIAAGVSSSSSSSSSSPPPSYELVMLDHARGHCRPTAPMPLTQQLLNSTRDHTPELIFGAVPTEGAKSFLPFAMAASMEATRGGRLWTCWAGGEDGPNAYLLCSCSDDMGATWHDPVFVIDPQATRPGHPMGTRLGSLWCDPLGRLWLFFHQSLCNFDGQNSNWYVRCDHPDGDVGSLQWSEPVHIGLGASLNKPIVRANGEWILPVSLWERWHIDEPFADLYRELDAVRGANVFVSDDEGAHWRFRGGLQFQDSCFNEHSVVELPCGTLWMLSRCMQEVAQSYSTDGGSTWSPQSSAFPQISSRCAFRKLASGSFLLIKHGQSMTEMTESRSHLTAFLWRADEPAWSGGLLLDERAGVSYPDACQAPNGDIFVHYDFDRTGAAEILFARFREEDIEVAAAGTGAGALSSHSGRGATRSQLKCVVKGAQGMTKGG
eukprot:COSAG05_NODE_52_length_23775_cov_49.471110_13_plen_445_part_00